MKKTLFCLVVLTLSSMATFAQHTADEIAKKVANPISSMVSVPFQFNFQFNINNAEGGENGYRMVMNLQPIIPVKLSGKFNLINRVIVPVTTQKDVTARNQKEEGLGDILYTGFISSSFAKVIWGFGPVVSIPLATNEALGTRKLAIGPGLIILGQPRNWTIGCLVNQLWTAAGDKSRADVNAALVQPFISHQFKGGFSAGIASENTYDWDSKRLVTGLASINLSQIIKIAAKQIASIQFSPLVFYGNANSMKPTWGARTTLTFIFLKKTKNITQN
ncbi:MAG: hypothetical protein WCR72_09170 [Bacteroidota bacterium]